MVVYVGLLSITTGWFLVVKEKYFQNISLQVQPSAECGPALPDSGHLAAHQHPPADGGGQEIQTSILSGVSSEYYNCKSQLINIYSFNMTALKWYDSC